MDTRRPLGYSVADVLTLEKLLELQKCVNCSIAQVASHHLPDAHTETAISQPKQGTEFTSEPSATPSTMSILRRRVL